MKVLISYASAGSGHRKAAQGIYNYLKQKKPYIDIGIVNALEKTNPLFEYTYIVGYNFLIRQGLGLWRLAYWITDVRFLRPLTRLMASIVNLLNCGNFIRFLIQENPDFVIATHFLPLEISNHLKNTQKIKSKVIAVITDFGVHSFWLSKGTDIYIVASEFTKKELVRQGVEEKRIKDLGIPVDSKFLTPYDRNCLSKKLGIDASRFTVLIMTGSFGVGPLEDIVKLLYKEVQILLVCAKNIRLYRKMTKMNLSNVRVFAFIDNPQDLMAVSDIIITKPGGLSISEILAMELVPVFISIIPGQEEINARILEKYGVGLTPRSLAEIKKVVLDLKTHQDKLRSIKDNIKKIRKPHVLEEICNVVCQDSARDTS